MHRRKDEEYVFGSSFAASFVSSFLSDFPVTEKHIYILITRNAYVKIYAGTNIEVTIYAIILLKSKNTKNPCPSLKLMYV